MKSLVTGAHGFVGRHLVDLLRRAGDTVALVDRHGDQPVDVTDASAVHDAVTRHAPDAVYHLAAVSHVGGSWDAPGRVFRVNAEGTLHVLRACADAGVGRVLVVGSADEYGSVALDDLPISEEAPLRPLTPYGASKVAADVLALQAFLGEGLPTIRVRAFNHTGPGQGPAFLVPGLAARIADAERAGRAEIAIGALDPVRDLSDVRDVVRAYRLLVASGRPGEAYNVCTGRGTSVGEIAERLIRLSGRALRLAVSPDLVRPVDVPRLVGDRAKLTAATGWTPEIAIDTTLRDVLEAARSAA
ncbi:MAG TPA: GDP-mannose 4,6-dehydratase [Acidimicrobiia bacterium]|nr:GDP-mannose 4,6-dehydratase [Acidimicrobiia bacterium]